MSFYWLNFGQLFHGFPIFSKVSQIWRIFKNQILQIFERGTFLKAWFKKKTIGTQYRRKCWVRHYTTKTYSCDDTSEKFLFFHWVYLLRLKLKLFLQGRGRISYGLDGTPWLPSWLTIWCRRFCFPSSDSKYSLTVVCLIHISRGWSFSCGLNTSVWMMC